MNRGSTIQALGAAALAFGLGCSAIGDPGGSPEALPHGGTGQFRPLSGEELGVFPPPSGRALVLSRAAFGGGMVAGEHLFYAAAPLRAEPEEVPDDWPEDEVFPGAFEGFRLFRSVPTDTPAFAAGEEVLSASAAWEGDSIRDPWAIVLPDGRVRLYYAADGGIGAAEASSIDGAFERAGTSPILEASGALMRRPSVIQREDESFVLYYEREGAIHAATSADGLSFDAATLTFEGEDLGESPEAAIGSPGALALRSPTGRWLARLYFESRREDGTQSIYVAGSADGLAFERHILPVMSQLGRRDPAPVQLDDRVTILYAHASSRASGRQVRALTALIAPGGASLLPEEDESEED